MLKMGHYQIEHNLEGWNNVCKYENTKQKPCTHDVLMQYEGIQMCRTEYNSNTTTRWVGYPNSSFIEPDVIQITIVETNTI